jgi:GMP synthase (glutamine-hydrolysing)
VREFGYAEVRARGHSKLLEGIQDRVNEKGEAFLEVWMSHGDKVTALPPGFKLIASNDACPIAGMADESRASTRCSSIPRSRTRSRARDLHALRARDLRRGPTGTCRASCPRRCEDPRAGGPDEVILGLRAAWTPAVAAALIHKAIGDQLTCIFVDTGPAAPERGATR